MNEQVRQEMNESQMRQAEDRIHRIHVPVKVIPIDVDEVIRDFRRKRAILDKILNETNEVIDE